MSKRSNSSQSLLARLQSRLEHAQRFFGKLIWSASMGELRRGQALLYRTSRVLFATVQGFREKRLNFRAAALTYFSILSIVPLLAFAFSVLKGFGLYQKLMEENLRPWVRATFGENEQLRTAIEQVLNFVDTTNVSNLGIGVVVFLAYTGISLLSTIETSLNDIWGAKSARPFIRQVTDYTTFVVITPLLVLVAITLAAGAQSSGVVTFLRESLALGPVIDFMLKLASLVLGCVAMIALFILMPNVRTQFTSVLLGGIVSGLLWQAVLLLHVKFQIGVANYNALYSGFGAFPIFLVWLYLSWLIVLLGAQLSAAHQYDHNLRQAIAARNVDQELRETLSIALSADIARGYLDGYPPRTQVQLVESFQLPAPTVESVLDALVKAGILIRALRGPELGYVPARDLDAIRLSDIRSAMRHDPAADEIKASVEQHLPDRLLALLHDIEIAMHQSTDNVSLRVLAKIGSVTPAEDSTGAGAQAQMAEIAEKGDVLDAKNPETPG